MERPGLVVVRVSTNVRVLPLFVFETQSDVQIEGIFFFFVEGVITVATSAVSRKRRGALAATGSSALAIEANMKTEKPSGQASHAGLCSGAVSSGR